MSDIDSLAREVALLDPQPRRHRWSSLTYCIADSVWSIGSNYNSVVVKVVRSIVAEFGDPSPVVDAQTALPPDPAPLGEFLGRFEEVEDLVGITNRQLTSTRNGPLKAAVALQQARLLQSFDVTNLADAQNLLNAQEQTHPVDEALRVLPGEGQYGIRRGYFWMLVGDDDRVKPDRMVLRWLRAHGADVRSPAHAADLLSQISAHLTASGRPVSAWEVDHAIWLSQRRK